MTQEDSHHLGHRQRLRERFLNGGEQSVADYELIELILFAAKPRGDIKPLAKELIKEFKSFYGVMTASPADLKKVKGMGDAAVASLKVIQTASLKLLRENAKQRPVMGSWKQVIDYCQAAMGHLKQEQFRLLFLDRHNKLIADEVQQTGTVDHTPVYPREVVKRALELGASALILVHNHPSGDTTPSRADINVTKDIQEATKKLDIAVHDHIIIGIDSHTSFKSRGLL